MQMNDDDDDDGAGEWQLWIVERMHAKYGANVYEFMTI